MIDGINIPIYEKAIAFFIEPTLEEFERFYYNNATKITDEEYKNIKTAITERNTSGFCMKVKANMYIIYIKKGYKDNASTVIHELYHATNRILFDAGVIPDEHNEPWAYLLGWLTKEYVNHIAKLTK